MAERVHGADVTGVHNRNEKRVAARLEAILAASSDYRPQDLDVQDIFALALNLLPSRYAQRGSIVLNEPVSDDEIDAAIRAALARVRERPNHS